MNLRGCWGVRRKGALGVFGCEPGFGVARELTDVFLCAVHRVRRARRHRWRWAQVTFWCADEQVHQLWLQTLRELLEKLSKWRVGVRVARPLVTTGDVRSPCDL